MDFAFLKSLVLKENPNHDALGRFSSSGVDSKEFSDLDRKIINYNPKKPLGAEAKGDLVPIAQMLPGAEYVPYTKTPFFDQLTALQGADPTKVTALEHKDARAAFFKTLPVQEVPTKGLIYTQNVINRKGVERLEANPNPQPAQVVSYEGKNYLMDGHHRTVAEAAQGKSTVTAHVLTINAKKWEFAKIMKGDFEGHPFRGNQWHGEGGGVKTGESVKLNYSRNTESAKGFKIPAGMDFGQKIEPHGEYMNVDKNTVLQAPNEKWTAGTITFRNPLVVEHVNTGSTGWKKTLSDHFGGKTGKALSSAIMKAGHDGILTYDEHGLSEAVNLKGEKGAHKRDTGEKDDREKGIKGDSPGHPFRGNGSTGGIEGGSAGGTGQGAGDSHSPTIREDGKVELSHWSQKTGLDTLDPSKNGTGIPGADNKRKERDPENWVDRTYHGLSVGQPGGYSKEAGLGGVRYTSAVDASKLYDIAKDPDHLTRAAPNSWSDKGSMLEKAIKDAGYEGYWRDHPQLGLVAATFNPLKPEKSETGKYDFFSILKGDMPGHPFHGNQYTTAGGSDEQRTGKERSAETATGAAGHGAVADSGGNPSGVQGEVAGNYRRGTGSDGAVTLNGKDVQVTRLEPSAAHSAELTAKGFSSPTYLELHGDNAARAFSLSIQIAKESNAAGASVHVYTDEEYKGMRLFLTENGKGGVAVKPSGDIVSVFNTPGSGNPGMVASALSLAVQHGGTHLDCFDTKLPYLYAKSGFVATSRTHWNDEFAPPGWNKETFKTFNKGEPDVVLMAYKSGTPKDYQPGDGKLVSDYDKAVALQSIAISKKLDFAWILKGAPLGNDNAKGHHNGGKSPGERRTKSISGKDALKAMQKAGWSVISVNGSHHKMEKDGIRYIVPVHGKDIGLGLLRKIEKETGMRF